MLRFGSDPIRLVVSMRSASEAAMNSSASSTHGMHWLSAAASSRARFFILVSSVSWVETSCSGGSGTSSSVSVVNRPTSLKSQPTSWLTVCIAAANGFNASSLVSLAFHTSLSWSRSTKSACPRFLEMRRPRFDVFQEILDVDFGTIALFHVSDWAIGGQELAEVRE